MAANITLAVRTPRNKSVEWVAGRKMVFVTATGSATAENDTGTLALAGYMDNPEHANIAGCSVSISGTTLTVTAKGPLSNAVFHGEVYSTVGDI